MTSVRRPRRPLPRRVYWVRRALVLGVAFALVFGIAHLLGAGGDQPTRAASARTAASGTTPSGGPTTGAAVAGFPAASATPTGKKKAARKTPTPLAVPTGPCADDDVVVTPSLDGSTYAGKDVTITLNLTTKTSPACTWQVSPRSVVLKVTSGSDRIWSTQDCPTAVPTTAVVVRQAVPAKVDVTWREGMRSDGECTTTGWAIPGYYHAEAAALGSDPTDAQFQLLAPVAPTIWPSPSVDPSADPSADPSNAPSDGASPGKRD